MKQKVLALTTVTICGTMAGLLVLKFTSSKSNYDGVYSVVYSVLLALAVVMLAVTNLVGDQKDDNFSVICDYLIPPLMIFIALLTLSITMICGGHRKSGFVLLGITVIGLVIFFCLPMPSEWFFADYNSELNPDDLLINGTWTNVYKHKDSDKVIKQISAPGVSHKDFSHVHIPTTSKICTRESCTIPLMLSHRLSTAVMWKSLNRIKDMNSKFFPKMYEMDDNKRRYVSEKVPYELTLATRPENFAQQMQELNDFLEKQGYYLDDVHSKNWMVDKNGQLKIVDCEVFTDEELSFQQSLLGEIDDSQDGVAKGHKNAPRILHWQDGRPNIETIY
jgi:hypothetical protein